MMNAVFSVQPMCRAGDMEKENRKKPRRPVRHTAWLALGPNQLHGCVVSDISEAGARIAVEDSRQIPNCFFLFLSSTGSARRVCRVIWREPTRIGVKFEASFAEAQRSDAATNPAKTADADEKPDEAVEPA